MGEAQGVTTIEFFCAHFLCGAVFRKELSAEVFKIDQLIIIGGVSCAGKSYLMKGLRHADYVNLRTQLNMSAPHLWHCIWADDLRSMLRKAY